MRIPWTALASLLLIALLTASCQKIGGEVPKGPLPSENIVFDNAISLQYGELVAVTQVQSGIYKLWFVKADKTIVVVGVNSGTRSLGGQILTIPRR